VAYRYDERACLAHETPPNDSALTQAETWTGGLCLGGSAPGRHAIGLEQAAQAREHAPGQARLKPARAGLNCPGSQAPREEAPGLRADVAPPRACQQRVGQGGPQRRPRAWSRGRKRWKRRAPRPSASPGRAPPSPSASAPWATPITWWRASAAGVATARASPGLAGATARRSAPGPSPPPAARRAWSGSRTLRVWGPPCQPPSSSSRALGGSRGAAACAGRGPAPPAVGARRGRGPGAPQGATPAQGQSPNPGGGGPALEGAWGRAYRGSRTAQPSTARPGPSQNAGLSDGDADLWPHTCGRDGGGGGARRRAATAVAVGRAVGRGRQTASPSQATEASRGGNWGAESGRRRARGQYGTGQKRESPAVRCLNILFAAKAIEIRLVTVVTPDFRHTQGGIYRIWITRRW